MGDAKSNNEDLNEKPYNEPVDETEENLPSSMTSAGEEVFGDDETGKSTPFRAKESESLESVQRYANRIKSFLGWEPYLEEFEEIASGLSSDTNVFPEFDDLSNRAVIGVGESGRPASEVEVHLEPRPEDSRFTHEGDMMELNDPVFEEMQKDKSDEAMSNLENTGRLPSSEVVSKSNDENLRSEKEIDTNELNPNTSFSSDLENISLNGNGIVKDLSEIDSTLQEPHENLIKSDQEVLGKSDNELKQELKENNEVEDFVELDDNSKQIAENPFNSPDPEYCFSSQSVSSENNLNEIIMNSQEDCSVVNGGIDKVLSVSDLENLGIISSPEIDEITDNKTDAKCEEKSELADTIGAKVNDQKVSDESKMIAENIEVTLEPESVEIENQNKHMQGNAEAQSENVKDRSHHKSERIVFKNCNKNPYMDQIRRLSLDIVKYVIESARNSVHEIVLNRNTLLEDASNENTAKTLCATPANGKDIKSAEDGLEADKQLKPELQTDQYLYHTLNKSCEDIEYKYKNNPFETLDRKVSIVNEDSECGIGCFKPRCIQSCARSKMYLTLFSILGVINGCYYSYTVSMITTLEKRYTFKSKISGLILLTDEIVPLLLGIFVGYIGTRTHRPRMVALGMLMASACCFVSGIPYLIFGSAKHSSSITFANETDFEFCDSEMVDKDCDVNVPSPTLAVVSIFILASLFKGFGTLSYYILGISYMDDNIKTKNSPLYLAIALALRLLGPLVGFLMSSAFLKIYENPFEDPGFGPDDPRWIGAWWIGFFLQGVLLLIFSLPIALFPRRLPGQKSMEKMTAPKSQDSWIHIFKDLQSALKRLGKNPVFVLLIIYTNAKIFGQFGHSIMLPKYMENQFRLSASEASLYSGATAITCIMIATVVGGFFIWKLRPGIKTLFRGIIVSDLLMCVGFLVLMIPRCQPANMVNFGSNRDGLVLEGECNEMCDCSTSSFTPFCGQDGKTFFSPCFAGCVDASTTSSRSQKEFHNCSCVAHSENQTLGPTISEGLCPDNGCWVNALIYLVILLIMVSISNSFTVVYTMVLLRSVHPNDKSIALGTFETFICLFGFIPFPITYGALVDSTCLVWEESCGETGNCWFYDMDKFAYLLHGVSASFCLLAVVCISSMYFLSSRVRDLYADEENEKAQVVDIKLDTVSESVTKL